MIFQPKIDLFSVFYTMNLQFMVLIYTCFARQSLYTMNLQFMVSIYTCFARQSLYTMNLQFVVSIYTCFARQSFYTIISTACFRFRMHTSVWIPPNSPSLVQEISFPEVNFTSFVLKE